MRIAIWHNLLSGGGKRALSYHIKALLNFGHYIEIWSPDTAYNHDLQLPHGIKLNILPLKSRLTNSHFRLGFRIVRRNKEIKKHCKMCVRQIEEKKFDLIFANSCSYNYISYISLYSSIPTVMYLGEPYRWHHEALPNYIWAAQDPTVSMKFLKDHIKLIPHRLQVLDEITAAKKYKNILVNSFFSRESVLRAYGIESSVCYLGVEDKFFNYPRSKKKNHLIGLGYLYYPKGVDRAIEIVSRININIRPKLIWIANGMDNKYENEVKLFAASKDVDLQIKINMPETDMLECISSAIAMVYTPRLEPFGFAPLEANALGTTVIGIAEGGLRETIKHGENGFLISGMNDIDSGVSFLESIINDNTAFEFGSKANKYAFEKWGFNKLSENINLALNSAIC